MIFSKRKTIGVFISKMFRVFDEAFYEALERESLRLDYDIVVFMSAGYYLTSSDYDLQEKNILKFAPLEKLDGIIAVPSTYEKGEFRNQLYELLEKRLDCPCVVVREEDPRFNCAYTDNTKAVRAVTRHLIEAHGLKRICMQAGDFENPEVSDRLEAFKAEMAAHGLAVGEGDVCTGNMWTNCGDQAFRAFFSDPDNPPQAVVCGNDYMAMGLIRELRKNGYRVPEDVIVTGFDNVTDWCPDVPSLTTIQPDYRGMVTQAMTLLDGLIRDGAPGNARGRAARIGLPGMLVLGESCGCGRRSEGFFRDLMQKTMPLLEAENDQDRMMNNMSIDLGACADLSELHRVLVSKRTESPILRDHYICLYGTPKRLTEETGSKACLVHAIRDHRDAGMPMATFDRDSLLPPMAERADEPQVFYIKLLHQMGHNFGYSVTHYDRGTAPSRCFVQVNALLSIALENIHRQRELMALYEERRLSSITDHLTGLLNRRGMNELVEPMWRDLMGREIAFICIDMDHLKAINDTFGHAAGDFAIRLVARAIQRSLAEGAAGVRLGGDEFIIFLPDAGNRAADKQARDFKAALEALNREEERAFHVSASAGFEVVKPGPGTTVDECLRASDQALYRAKAARPAH